MERPTEPRTSERLDTGAFVPVRMPLVRFAALVVVVAGLRAAEPVLIPMLLAVFLAVLSHPLQAALQHWGVRPSLALSATVLAVLVVVIACGLLVNSAVSGFLEAVPTYHELLTAKVDHWIEMARKQGVAVDDWIGEEPFDVSRWADLAGGLVGGTVRGVASFISLLFMTLVGMIFMLGEALDLGGKLRRAFGERPELLGHFSGITRNVQRYVGVKTFMSLIIGVLVGAWTAVLGVEFPVVWGVLAFFMHYIPNFGAILSAAPPALVALAQHGWGSALLVTIGYLVIGSVLGNIIEPALMGRRVGLSPLAVLLSLVFWGWLWGPIGMILSVPVTVVLKISLEHTKQLRWLAVLLGPSDAGGRLAPANVGQHG
jgi:predicted PurR-regulated permease PerM